MDRFKEAQEEPGAGVDVAVREIQAGGKRGHWIWYVFPQLAGLGMSSMAMRYGIEDVDEAIEYLQDDTLRDRLLTITRAIATQLAAPRSATLPSLMGSRIDAQKLVSSLTLFGHVAERLHAGASPGNSEPARGSDSKMLADFAELASLAREILTVAAAEGYPPCQFTLTRFDRRSP